MGKTEYDWKDLYGVACDGTKLKLKKYMRQEEAARVTDWAEKEERNRVATLEWQDQQTYIKLFGQFDW